MTDTEMLDMIEKHTLEVARSNDTGYWVVWDKESHAGRGSTLRAALLNAVPRLTARHLT